MNGPTLAILATVARIGGYLALLGAAGWLIYALVAGGATFTAGWFILLAVGIVCVVAAPKIGEASIKATLR